MALSRYWQNTDECPSRNRVARQVYEFRKAPESLSNKEKTKKAILNLVRKSHRNLGIFLVFFLVLISVTGMLLNHTDALNLNHHSVPAFVAARYYSDNSGGLTGFESAGDYFYTFGGELHINRQVVASCRQIEGAIRLKNLSIVLCDGELNLFTSDRQLIETMGAVMGVPDDLVGISVLEDQLVLRNVDNVYSFDIETLALDLIANTVQTWPERQVIPSELLLAESISWQQFILDLHSGVFVGSMGKWLSDLVALFVIAMAISGLSMWRNPR